MKGVEQTEKRVSDEWLLESDPTKEGQMTKGRYQTDRERDSSVSYFSYENVATSITFSSYQSNRN